MKRTILDRLLADRRAGRPVVRATALEGGAEALFYPDDAAAAFAGTDLIGEVRAAVHEDRPRTVETASGDVFLNVFNPPLKLYLVGAVHIAQALAPMAAAAGYRVTVIDPRGAFATAERFAGVTLAEDWPDDALAADPPDARTAVVALTHDPKLDDAALAAALASPAFYVGALGSRKTHAARLERLRGAGVAEDALARLHGGPVGLDIGARSPAEIAVSILAEMTQVLRTGHVVR